MEREKIEVVLKADDAVSDDLKRGWEEYKLYAGFFQFFLDFGLKANVFFYGITGVILTILYNSGSPRAELSIRERLGTEVVVLLLGTPFIIGVALAVAFISGAYLWAKIANQMYDAQAEQKIELMMPPRLHYLTVMLTVFGTIFLLVSAGLVWVICAT